MFDLYNKIIEIGKILIALNKFDIRDVLEEEYKNLINQIGYNELKNNIDINNEISLIGLMIKGMFKRNRIIIVYNMI